MTQTGFTDWIKEEKVGFIIEQPLLPHSNTDKHDHAVKP